MSRLREEQSLLMSRLREEPHSWADYPVKVTAADDRAYDTDLLDVLAQRVLVGGGIVETKYVRLQSG
nr:hypothetical protein [Mycolicibacterium frederiksbergense]